MLVWPEKVGHLGIGVGLTSHRWILGIFFSCQFVERGQLLSKDLKPVEKNV